MDLSLTEEQQLLVDSARRFLARSCPPSAVRAAEALPTGHDTRLWGGASAQGWPGLCLPEHFGGGGARIIELTLLAEELGRVAFPSPLLVSTSLVALPLVWAGSDALQERWLPALASGAVIGAPAIIDPAARDEWTAPTLSGHATGARWRLEGSKILVPFAETSHVLTVTATLEAAGPTLLVLERDRVHSIVRQQALGGDPLYAVDLTGVEVGTEDVVGTPGQGTSLLERALDHAATAAVGYAVGLGEAALQLSVEHATDREQFGRPIGTFQGVSHRCADMRTDLDAARWLARQAASALGSGRVADLEVGAAKAWGNEALRRVFLNAHQVHGAIGFSLEHDLQLYTRRAKAFELTYGDVARHRRRVAAAMGLAQA